MLYVRINPPEGGHFAVREATDGGVAPREGEEVKTPEEYKAMVAAKNAEEAGRPDRDKNPLERMAELSARIAAVESQAVPPGNAGDVSANGKLVR